jgi:hypothetical protein
MNRPAKWDFPRSSAEIGTILAAALLVVQGCRPDAATAPTPHQLE